jgi:hypothetical protein
MTMKLSRMVAATALLGLSVQASAATYEFDTVTAYQGGYVGAITGLPRNSTTPITVDFTFTSDNSMGCVPVFLTMLEKPGRYYLTIVRGDVGTAPPLQGCTLTLRN